MNGTKLREVAQEIAASGKTQEVLFGDQGIFKQLIGQVIQAALQGEMDEHLGYQKHARTKNKNARNGTSKKHLHTTGGTLEIEIPRDREASFEPELVKKQQTRFDGLDDKIIALYACGMSTKDIQEQIKELYAVEISSSFVSKVTDSVLEEVQAWQNRPLERLYPIVYMDCLVVKVRENKQIINKAVYLALGVNDQGQKELLGMWMSPNEGAKFWAKVLTELKNRGLEDILIACVDGLTGFPEAIKAVYPKTEVQLCIVHMVRSSLKYVPLKDRKKIAAALKEIYTASTEEEASTALEKFGKQQGKEYEYIVQIWRKHWENLVHIFSYPPEIRRAIYTTNAIESLNMSLRKVLKNKRVFPSDSSVFKILYLASIRISAKWTMPIRDWPSAMNFFMIKFGDRVSP